MDIIKINQNQKINVEDKIVVGIGQFDGLHRGHMKLIAEVKKLALKKNCRTGIITFDPHPDFVLGKRANNGYITPLSDKIKILTNLNIDYLFVIHFTNALSQMEPTTFYEKYLAPFAAIVIGSDYHYGYKGRGNSKTLKETGKEIVVVELVEYDHEKIGSNKIRNLLMNGRVNEIYKLLNRYYKITGVVSRGSQIGRTLGFKTANVELNDEYQIIKKGVYAVLVKVNNLKYLGVCNIGNNPSVNYVKKMRLEVHILDFEDDIYGQEIEIVFFERIRDELIFDNKESLIAQINKDISYVRRKYKE